MTTTKSVSQIALALGVAAFFTACGADSSKAPKIRLYNWESRMHGVRGTSQYDDTVIKEVNVYGRDGKCIMENVKVKGDDYNGEKISYGTEFYVGFDKDKLVSGEAKCDRKNGAYEIEIKTNFGTYTYENKDGKTTLK